MIWKAAEDDNQPVLDIAQHGWKTVDGKPEPVYGITEIAPKELLEVVACKCKATTACSRNTCSCKKAGISCTTYCKCEALEDKCHNEHTHTGVDENNEDDNEADMSDVDNDVDNE